MTDLPIYVLDREFNAPRDLVWRTWTEAEFLSHWYGPGVTTIIHKLDVRAGGVWLNEMKMGDRSAYERMDYTQVDPKTRLEWHHSVTDADWNPAANPMMPDWPRVLLTVVTFTDLADGRTAVRLTWTPHEANDAEIACFTGAMAGLDQGWGKGMQVLEDLLETLKA
ncbi:MAG: SRPBCC domain-containing protein [Paracoccaceae bacterium]